MAKLVSIDLLGDLQSGCKVNLEIFTEGDRDWIGKAQAQLPARPQISDRYVDWQSHYLARVAPMRVVSRINVSKPPDASIPAIKKARDRLNFSVNEWLSSGEMFPVKEELLRKVKDEREEIRFIFNVENSELRRLPWHSWHIFNRYYVNAEAGLYLPVGTRHPVTPREGVRVLAVFGRREALGQTTIIRTDRDWEMLESHLSARSNAEIIRLVEPTLEELGEQLERQRPQILFFAGHSNTEEDGSGLIALNQKENITIDDLRHDLREAIERGLQLAVFNSCDGLGIARQLEKLEIPNIIVMRESVPDEVAQRFLQRFLEAFAAGKPLHIAMRKAREKMKRSLDSRFPGASELPVIFQNPARPPLTWPGLGGVVISGQRPGAPQPGEGSQTNNQDSIVWLPSEVSNPAESERKPPQKEIDNLPESEERKAGPIGGDNLSRLQPQPLSEVSNLSKSKLQQPPPEGDNSSPPGTPSLSGANRSASSRYCSKGHGNQAENRFCIRCGEPLKAPTAKVENSLAPQQQESPARVEGSLTPQPQYPPSGIGKRISMATPIQTSYGSASESAYSSNVLAGRYRIISTLASGGFAKTYLAQDEQRPGHPKCVVKQLRPVQTDPSVLEVARRLFDREAEVLEELGRHPQIPQLLAHLEENQEFYLVQEFIEGKALNQELLPGTRWSESNVVNLLQDVLTILDFVHGHNVVHRDIKPSNLIRCRQDGRFVLIDFGAVKRIGRQTLNSPEFTDRTVGIGTPGYRPLEQAQGRPRHCSDVYALGMLAIQALTGVDPLRLLEDPRAGELIWRQEARVSPRLAEILDKMVRCDFKERYQSAAAVLLDLDLLTAPVPRPCTPPASIPKYRVTRLDRKPALIAALAAFIVMTVLALKALILPKQPALRPSAPQPAEQNNVIKSPY